MILHVNTWAPDGALPDSGDVIAASAGEAATRAGGTVTRERYAVLVFGHEAPPRGGQEARVTPMTVEPSMLPSVEDAVAWYGATAGEAAAAAALNGVIGASGEYRLVFSSARPA
jgi:hypothetical protein